LKLFGNNLKIIKSEARKEDLAALTGENK